jgi:membrane-bound metal-dependent hydrolase YbcI (DUF457 family)
VILVLALVADVSRVFAVGALVGGVLIDLDHAPQYLGTEFLTRGTPRPYTHSLLMLAAVGFVAWRASGRLAVFMSGAALGLASHLIRDMAEPGQNGGVALLWPVSDWGGHDPLFRLRAPPHLPVRARLVSAGMPEARGPWGRPWAPDVGPPRADLATSWRQLAGIL